MKGSVQLDNKSKDGPWDEVIAKANAVIAQGGFVFQKFTCANCKARNTMEDINTFYVEGTCQDCGHTTNIKDQGTGFSLVFGADPKTLRDVLSKITGKVVPAKDGSTTNGV